MRNVDPSRVRALAPAPRLGPVLLTRFAPLPGARTGVTVTDVVRSGRDRCVVLRLTVAPLEPDHGSSPECLEKRIPLQPTSEPRVPRRIGTVELASYYRAADPTLDVGGDWFDAFAVDGGLMLVVGDVQGHDDRAAKLMARLRAATRAAASRECTPGVLLARVGDFLDRLDCDLLATLLVVHVDDNSRTATVASAGHLPPTLLTRGPGGAMQAPTPLQVDPGPPLGVGEHWEESTTQLPSDAVLLLYTDGLVETREHDIEDAVRRLGEGITGSPAAAGAVLEAAIETRPTDDLDDDVAVLVAHI